MGYLMRTDRYRYAEWSEPGREPVGIELYDHRADPCHLADRVTQKRITRRVPYSAPWAGGCWHPKKLARRPR